MEVTRRDLEAMGDANKNAYEITVDLDELVNGLHDFLQARFGCWGDDDTGEQFANNYVPHYEKYFKEMFKALELMKEPLDEFKHEIKRALDIDERNARILQQQRDQQEQYGNYGYYGY